MESINGTKTRNVTLIFDADSSETQALTANRPVKIEPPPSDAKRLTVEEIDGEPRIKDVLLGQRLGMAQPLNIRGVIEKNAEELRRYGPIHAANEMVVVGSGARREVTAYYLNEAQALLLCMQSRTERAADVRQEVIDVYMAYRRSLLTDAHNVAKPAIPDFTDPAAAARAWADEYDRRVLVEEHLAIAAPKADVFDKIASTDDSFCIRDAGKALGMSQKDFFAFLDKSGYIFRQGSEWRAYQDKIDAGLFVHKVRSVQDGEKSVVQCRVTAKGLANLAELMPRSELKA